MKKENATQPDSARRERVIVRTSLIGIGANLLLAGFKAAVGLLSNSIAVLLDAVNNLSDVISSVVTIVGTRLAGKKPDQKHPLGHGRSEYLAAMVVAAIVLYAGITALVESVKKIFAPQTPDYSAVSLVIIGAAVVVKLLLGYYVRRVGKRVRSGSLIASGADALFDAILSASVLFSAVFFIRTGISLEAYVGVLIAAFIIKAGVEMLMETRDELLGKRLDPAYAEAVKNTICAEPEVSGAYDLLLHNYGPEKYVGSVHIEIPDTLTADEIDALERRIAERVYREHGVLLAGVGIYARNTRSSAVKEMRSELTRLIHRHDGVLQIHGFFVDEEKKQIHFDVILDFELPDRDAVYAAILHDVQQAFPDYTFRVTMDLDL